MSEAAQLGMFSEVESTDTLDTRLWRGSFNARESSLHQLSPYVGKLKSGMVRVLIRLYSKPGDRILDPFSGSGVVPLEAVLAGREALANDLSPYAYTVTRGKLEASGNEQQALAQARAVIEHVEREAPHEDVTHVPEWVRAFFHPQTLPEIVAAFRILKQEENFFLTACLLGILHHQRPGFLSYPASHLVPYLRRTKYPPEEYPGMYLYRDLRSRPLAKVGRAYRNPAFTAAWASRAYSVWQANAMDLPIEDGTIDTIISSPPYFGALDYARDNRLRLWFLGCDKWKDLDASLTASQKVYLPQMALCLKEMNRVLKRDSSCVLVLGDVEKDGKSRRTAEILGELAVEVSEGRFGVETMYNDLIPDERRSRRRTRTTKFERILVLRKREGAPA